MKRKVYKKISWNCPFKQRNDEEKGNIQYCTYMRTYSDVKPRKE
jgi:hypothetical protein